MSRFDYRTKIDFGVTLVVVLVGGFFAVLAMDIDPASDEIVGPRFAPLFLSVAMIALGILVSLIAWKRGGARALAGDADIPEEEFGFRNSDVRRVAAVIGCGFAYIILFILAGYLLATLISLVLILLAFGNVKIRTLVLLPVAAAVIYQFVFMGLMGLHDPAGSLIDVRVIGQWISGN